MTDSMPFQCLTPDVFPQSARMNWAVFPVSIIRLAVSEGLQIHPVQSATAAFLYLSTRCALLKLPFLGLGSFSLWWIPGTNAVHISDTLDWSKPPRRSHAEVRTAAKILASMRDTPRALHVRPGPALAPALVPPPALAPV